MQKTEEEWKTIPHTFGRYSISTLGRIKSYDTFATRIHSGRKQSVLYNGNLNHVGRLAAPMRRVKRMDDGTIYPSISAAARSQGVSVNKIRLACEHETLIDGSLWEIIDSPGKPTELVERAKRPVLCVETGKIYESLTEAAKDVGRCISAIAQVLSGKSHVCAGYHWRYADGN